MEKRIAKIIHTSLGWEDHGLFVVDVRFDYGSSQQGLGRVADNWQPMVEAILKAAGVSRWEKLVGRTVYALIENDLVEGMKPLPTEPGTGFLFRELYEEA